MWLSEGKLNVKIAHFWLPSASQKRTCLSSLLMKNVKCGTTAFRIEAYLKSKNVEAFQRIRLTELPPAVTGLLTNSNKMSLSLGESAFNWSSLYPKSQRIPLKHQYFISYFAIVCKSFSTVASH